MQNAYDKVLHMPLLKDWLQCYDEEGTGIKSPRLLPSNGSQRVASQTSNKNILELSH